MPMKQKPMMAMTPTTRLCVTEESLTAGKRNGFLRVFNGIHVDRCRFESQEGPQRQGDRIADGIAESQIIGVPRSQPRSRAEPMPADDGNAQDRDDGTPDGNGAELAGITGAAEIEGCRDPQ